MSGLANINEAALWSHERDRDGKCPHCGLYTASIYSLTSWPVCGERVQQILRRLTIMAYENSLKNVRYRCDKCGAGNVKLWREPHAATPLYCKKCATHELALDEAKFTPSGKYNGEYGESDHPLFNFSGPKQTSLLPAVPAPQGGMWGYTSIPPEACLWWDSLQLEVK